MYIISLKMTSVYNTFMDFMLRKGGVAPLGVGLLLLLLVLVMWWLNGTAIIIALVVVVVGDEVAVGASAVLVELLLSW